MAKILNNINTYADLTAYNADLNKDYPNVSYIQGTDEVKWNKYDPDHIVCVYNVTSTESATKLLNSNSGITYQIIDGVQQDTVQTSYTFSTTGEHIVKYKLSGTSIAYATFGYCTNLISVTIPSGVTSIGSSAFQNCSSLTSVTIGNSVTSIGQSAFYGCSGLTSVTIPNGVTSIGTSAFQNCSSLTSVTIPSGVTTINNNVFSGCRSLTSVNIPNSVTSIGSSAFFQCFALASIVIPDSVTSIGAQCFRVAGLTSITFPVGVTSFGSNVFNDCTSLTSVTINATTPPTIASDTFSDYFRCPIYVPSESVEAYKTTGNWVSYASRIQAIPTT